MRLSYINKILLVSTIFFLLTTAPLPALQDNIHIRDNLITKEENDTRGYILFSPEYNTNAFLIETNGRLIKVWNSDYFQAMGTALTKNGELIRSCSRVPNLNFPFGGITGRVEMFNWKGNLIWEYEYSNAEVCLHHDIEPLPNGNILMIAWEYKNVEEAIEAGVNPDLISGNKKCPDHIIEVEPTFPTGGTIVWEWHAWDHLIQNYDSSKQNYGIIKNHPELIDVNFVDSSDMIHMNSIDYIEEYDQILISANFYNEIWIIDHSTTTEEAAGHIGGRYGKGGDLLYRWGNPQTYQRGTNNDHQLFFQHDARWIEPGKPGEGNILIFNNGRLREPEPYSSVLEIIPPIDEQGNYNLQTNLAYEPASPIWIYTADTPTDFYADLLSGAQRLPNGNTIICDGPGGYFLEVNTDNDILWKYENTLTESIVNPLPNDIFTFHYYSLNYRGIGSYVYLDPEKPIKPRGETNLRTGQRYTFSSKTTDPNGDNLAYFFDWGDDKDSGWLGSYSSGTEISASHKYREPGSYQIRVKAKDMNNYDSQWSDPLIVNVTLSEVFLIGKLDGMTERDSEIVFWADKLIMITRNPFKFESFPFGVNMVVEDEYTGILTNNFIIGKFYMIE